MWRVDLHVGEELGCGSGAVCGGGAGMWKGKSYVVEEGLTKKKLIEVPSSAGLVFLMANFMKP